MSRKIESKADVQALAEADLYAFARLVNPHRVYGECHKNLFRWWMQREEMQHDCSVVLWPRDHQKSHCAAVYAAWCITRDPACTILYVSATAALAEKQLKAIKDILTSEVYTRYWGDMVHPDEGKREKWTTTEIAVDHPKRRAEGVRDSTVFAAGLTTNVTGFHASHVFLDDIVVPGNAYTEDGREKVRALYSQLASIETTGAKEIVVGTRYHPRDIYQDLMDMTEPVFDAEGNIESERKVYQFSVEVVERDGRFLWPKEYRTDGKPFGFDQKELARKKAKYLDTTQFYAQYYQEPNDPGSHRISYDKFQYFDPTYLKFKDFGWHFKHKRLKVYAAVDFAFSTAAKADFTAIVVIGIDADGMIYVLDIDRYKATNVETHFEHVLKAHQKWDFTKLRAEVNAGSSVIVQDLKSRIAKEGSTLSIDTVFRTRHEGTKEERVAAVLEPRYENQVIWHQKGGYTTMLEEEIVQPRPAHDDMKDALASAIEIAKPPRKETQQVKSNVVFHSRFGGVAR